MTTWRYGRPVSETQRTPELWLHYASRFGAFQRAPNPFQLNDSKSVAKLTYQKVFPLDGRGIV